MLETIKLGSTGNLVKVAQYLTGYAAVKKATGNFDEAFATHFTEWQAKNGLAADAVDGPVSWTKMAENAPTCSTSKNAKSAYTCAVQLLVGGLTVDGSYGSCTKKGVAAFQSASGLKADGVCGAKTWKALICGVIDSSSGGTSGAGGGQTVSGSKILNKCVHYLQWDSKWKNKKYSTHTSSQTIGNSGCGPSSMAMIMATWIDKKITPVEMCKLSVDNGYRTYDSGTAWGFFEYVYKHYSGFKKFVKTSSVEALKAGLKDGALAVCSMNNNDNCFWTKGGFGNGSLKTR